MGSRSRFPGLVTALVAGAVALGGIGAPSDAGAREEQGKIWQHLRQKHFGDRPIHQGQEVVGLKAPDRAEDPALVPITIEDRTGQDRRIRRLWLVIDNNPRPMAADFRFGPAASTATLSTRIRINAYTNVRAIAETAEGELYMAKHYVKASGGCAAPISDQEEDPNLGKMRLRFRDAGKSGSGLQGHLMVRHPQVTGLQMNQITRLYPQPHYIDRLEVTYGGQRLMDADLTFTLSKNPSLRFHLDPAGKGQKVEVKIRDNQNNRFSTAKEVGA